MYQAVTGSNPSYNKASLQHPVECVYTSECSSFITILNKYTSLVFSFPVKTQWQYAAKGGSSSQGYIYSGSDDPNLVAWYTENSNGKTHKVKTKQANELGIYDMCGNVREWCHDAYNDYPDTHQKNPLQTYGKYRYKNHKIVRGGHYTAEINKCGPTSRGAQTNDYKGCGTGFRLAMSIEKS